jgi:hypothetical protein
MQSKTIAATLVLASLAMVSLAAGTGGVESDSKVASQSREAVQKQTDKTSELKKLINADVAKGLEKTRQAVKTLDAGKNKECLALLKEAVGSFDVALAAEPKLNLVPVSSIVHAQELYTNPESLKRELSYARELLQGGKVQEARSVLLPLRSDIAVQTTYLPMRTYPDAIRVAIKAMVSDKPEEAKAILATAMNTLFIEEKVAAPIPLVTARSLIDEAAKMDKSKKDDVMTDLSMAKEQLEVARLLGYLTEEGKQYEEMQERIKKIMAEVRGENKAATMYQELKDAIGRWLPW